MNTYSQNFSRAAKRIERSHFLPEATARRVAELAGFRTDRDLPDTWIPLGLVVDKVLAGVISNEQSTRRQSWESAE